MGLPCVHADCFIDFQNYDLSKWVNHSNNPRVITDKPWMATEEDGEDAGKPRSQLSVCPSIALLICNLPANQCWDFPQAIWPSCDSGKLFEVCVVLKSRRKQETSQPKTSNALDLSSGRCLAQTPKSRH